MRYSALRLQRGNRWVISIAPTHVTRDGKYVSVNAVEERRVVGYKQIAEVDGMIYMYKSSYEKIDLVLIPEVHPIFNSGMFYMNEMFNGDPGKTFPDSPCDEFKALVISICSDAFDDKLVEL